VKELSMKKMMILAGLAAAIGCAPPEQPSSFIQAVLPLVGPECTADAGNSSVAVALLDIGNDAQGANSLVLPVQVRTNLPSTFTTQTLQQDRTNSPNYPFYGNVDNNIITFTQSEVFFTTDFDAAGEPALVNEGTPVNDATVRISGVSGVAFNEQTTLLSASVIFTTVITAQDAARLQDEPFINQALTAANPAGSTANRARITANIRLVGSTTGAASVRTPPFPFPVELCAGCLTTVPNCGERVEDDGQGNIVRTPIAPIANNQVCVAGQDFPSFVCP
jgi:hypothetical protein